MKYRTVDKIYWCINEAVKVMASGFMDISEIIR